MGGRGGVGAVWVAVLAGLAMLASGCATPVGVTRVDTSTAYRILTESALSAGQPSEPSKTVLRRLGVLDGSTMSQRPCSPSSIAASAGGRRRPSVCACRAVLPSRRANRRARAISWPRPCTPTLSFSRARQREVACPVGPSPPARLRSLQSGAGSGAGCDLAGRRRGSRRLPTPRTRISEIRLEGGTRALPFGTLELDLDPSGLSMGGYRLQRFISTTTLEVRGLRNRYRRPGLGAALAASLAPGEASPQVVGARRIGPHIKVPVTAVLRIENPRASLASGKDARPSRGLSSRPGLHRDAGRTAAAARGRPDGGACLPARGQSDLGPRDRSVSPGPACSGVMIPRDRTQDGLFFMQPYQPGKIPVVLVHGTASSPARWAELGNELAGRCSNPGAVSHLAVPLRHRQPHRLFGRASARGAGGDGAGARPRGQGPGAPPHGGDRAQPGRAPHQAHGYRQRDAILGQHQ